MLIYRYSQWDGTQEVFELHEDDLMEAVLRAIADAPADTDQEEMRQMARDALIPRDAGLERRR